MAAVRSVSNTTYASRTNTTITAPASIADDDILLLGILTVNDPDAVDTTPPTGFTLLTNFPIDVTDGGGLNMEFRVYWKTASGESGNYTVTHASSSSQGWMVCVQDADTISVTPTVNNGTAASTTALSITTTVNDSLVILMAFDWGDSANNLTGPTGTTPTFVEKIDVAPLIYVTAGVLATAGATDNKTMANNSSTGSPWGATLIVVQPAAAAPGSTPVTVPGAVLNVPMGMGI